MTGKSHIIVNVCSATILASGVNYLHQCSFSSVLIDTSSHVVTNLIIDFIKPESSDNIWGYMGLCFLLFIVGSLLPDIDSATSLLGRFVHLPLGHRTWTHTVWFILPFVVLSGVWPCVFWLWSGYLLHLFWDSLSRGGVCYFYPLSEYRNYRGGAKMKKKHIFKFYKTGSISEYVFVCLIIVWCGVIMSANFQYQLLPVIQLVPQV